MYYIQMCTCMVPLVNANLSNTKVNGEVTVIGLQDS